MSARPSAHSASSSPLRRRTDDLDVDASVDVSASPSASASSSSLSMRLADAEEEEEDEDEERQDGWRRGQRPGVGGDGDGGKRARRTAADDGERELTVDDVLSADDGGAAAAAASIALASSAPSKAAAAAAPSHGRSLSMFASLGLGMGRAEPTAAGGAFAKPGATAGRPSGAALLSVLTSSSTRVVSASSTMFPRRPLLRAHSPLPVRGAGLAGFLEAAPPRSAVAAASSSSSSAASPFARVPSSAAEAPGRRSFGASLGLNIASAIRGGAGADDEQPHAAGAFGQRGGRERSASSGTPISARSSASSRSASPSSSPSSASLSSPLRSADPDRQHGGYRSAFMIRRTRLSGGRVEEHKRPPAEEDGRMEESKTPPAGDESAVRAKATAEPQRVSAASLSASSVELSPPDSPGRAPTFHMAADDDARDAGESSPRASAVTADAEAEAPRSGSPNAAAVPAASAHPVSADDRDEDDAEEYARADAVRRQAEKEEAARVQQEQKDREAEAAAEREKYKKRAKEEEREREAARSREAEQRRRAEEQRKRDNDRADAARKADNARQREEEGRREAERVRAQEAATAVAAAPSPTKAAATASSTSSSPAGSVAPSTLASALPSPDVDRSSPALCSLPAPLGPSRSAPSSVPAPLNATEWKAAAREDAASLVQLLLVQSHLHPFPHASTQQRPARVAYLLARFLLHLEALRGSATPAATLPSTLSALSASSSLMFRSAYSPSFASSLSSQQSLRFLPSAARAKSVDPAEVFPHPLPFSSLSAAPKYSLPQSGEQDEDADQQRPVSELTAQDRSYALSALLHALHAALHAASNAEDRAQLCALFATVVHLRRFTQRSATPSPVLERAYAIAFLPSSPLLPAAPPALSSFLYPSTCELPVDGWFSLLLLDCQALAHQLVVQQLLLSWQSSAPPVQLIWQEDEGLSSPVLEAYCALYAALDADCKAAGWTLPQRQTALAVCLRCLVTALFNSVVLGVSNLTMEVGLRVKLVCSSLTDWGLRQCGDGFTRQLLPLLQALQELAMVLLMDKSACTLSELTAVAPHLSLLTIHHLLFVYLQSEGNEEDSVSPSLLAQLAQAAAAKEQREQQPTDAQHSPQLPTQIVLLLDLSLARDSASAAAGSASGGLEQMEREREDEQWEAPEAVEHHDRFAHLRARAKQQQQ